YLLDVVAQERARWADPAFAAQAAALGATVPGTRSWTNLGPLAARNEFNGTYYKAMDSGRPTAIAVHPDNPNLVFLGTSGGGVWFGDMSSNYPFWAPITDGLGALAIGAIAIDPHSVGGDLVTVWLGLGDHFDQQLGVLVRGTYKPSTGEAIWGSPITLSAAAHQAERQQQPARRHRRRPLRVHRRRRELQPGGSAQRGRGGQDARERLGDLLPGHRRGREVAMAADRRVRLPDAAGSDRRHAAPLAGFGNALRWPHRIARLRR